MASTWNGTALQVRYVQKYGFNDSTSYIRVLEWLNDVQDNIQSGHQWPNLKMKLKRQVISGEQEINISPMTASAPTIALLAGGSITTASACYVKVTFLIFDESGKEINSIESEAGAASNTVTVTGSDLSLTVTNIDTFDGSATVKPTVIHRRIYLKVGTDAYFLAATLTDNTTTTTTLTIVPTSVVEPPEYSLISVLADEDPIVEASGLSLTQSKLSDILASDPGLLATGTPTNYARLTDDTILVYPRASATYTISFWVYKVPCRIFADTDRPIQLHHALKEALDAGFTFKFYEYKDQDGQESKRNNFTDKVQEAKGIIGRVGGQALSVRVVV